MSDVSVHRRKGRSRRGAALEEQPRVASRPDPGVTIPRPARLRHVEPHLRGPPRTPPRSTATSPPSSAPPPPQPRSRRGRRLSRRPPPPPPRLEEPAARAAVVIARRGAESAAVFAVRGLTPPSPSPPRARPPRRRAAATEVNPRIVVSLLLSPLALWVVFGDRRASVWEKRIQVPKKVARRAAARTPSPEPRRPAPPTDVVGVSAEEIDEIRGDPRRPPSLGRSDRQRATFFDSRDIFSDDSIGIRTTDFRVGGGVDGRDPTRAADRRDAGAAPVCPRRPETSESEDARTTLSRHR